MDVDVENDAIVSGNCTCPYNYGGICKHMVATGLSFIEQYYKQNTLSSPAQKPSISLNKIINDFEEIDHAHQQIEEEYKFILKPIATANGKQLLLKIPPWAENAYAALPWRYATLIAYLSKAPKYNNAFILNGITLDRMLDMLSSFDNVFGSDEQQRIVFSNDFLKLPLNVTQKDNGDIQIIAEEKPEVFFGKHYAYTLENNTIKRLSPEVPLSFYKALYENGGTMTIPSSQTPSFIERMLPQLRQRLPVTAPDLPEVEHLAIKPEIHIYLQRGNTRPSIILKAFAKYGQYFSRDLFDYSIETQMADCYKVKQGKKIVFIQRDRQQESATWNKLINRLWYGAGSGQQGLVFDGSERIYRFINDFQKIVEPDWNIHYEDGLEDLKIHKRKITADFDFSMADNQDFFEFDVEFHCKELNISRQQLEEYIKNNQRFIEIDGQFVEITNRRELQRLFDILSDYNAVNEKRYRGKLYTFPALDSLMEENRAWKASGNKAFNDFKYELDNSRLIESVALPQNFNSILREYQRSGVNWMTFLKKYGFGGILADDMGLGKTLQALVMLSLNRSAKPSLVICPKTLVYNWYNEVQKFTPHLKAIIIDGNSAERFQLINDIDQYDLAITSYNAVQKDVDYLAKTKFEFCIIDEAQYIKNPRTKTAKSVKSIPARYRLALTGTPIENNLMELWSIFDFLMPDLLGTEDEFKRRYDIPITKYNDKEVLNELRNRIAPFILRRTKQEMLHELPPKIEQISYAHLTTEQLALYTKVLEQVRSNVFSTVERKGFERSHIEILAALMRLRQVCNHPALLSADNSASKKLSSGKLEQFEELLEEAIDGDHKVLVFSQFTQMLHILAEYLDKKGLLYCYLDGQTRDRQRIIDRFNSDPSIKIFLISIKAGGFGLNLTSADTVIIFDPWWNPMVEMQAADRVYRIGQTRPVNVYKLITRGTIEEKILKLQEKKKALFDDIIGENDEFIKKLTWDDIREVFA